MMRLKANIIMVCYVVLEPVYRWSCNQIRYFVDYVMSLSYLNCMFLINYVLE